MTSHTYIHTERHTVDFFLQILQLNVQFCDYSSSNLLYGFTAGELTSFSAL